jgi:hypothetical protein
VRIRVGSGKRKFTYSKGLLHSFKPSSGSLPWLPRTFRNPSICVPNVISGQIDVLPPQRCEMNQQLVGNASALLLKQMDRTF